MRTPLRLRLGHVAAAWLLQVVGLTFSLAEPLARADGAGHAIDIPQRTLAAEEGLLLGNGDLSVSVYQTADRIVWRLGKGDVWDRRLDLSDDPRPAHIDEIAHGIRDEGWKCGPYGGPVEATRGTDHPERMRELCQGAPPSYNHRPYPCPKPVGELALHLPPDLPGIQVHQRLRIEEAVVEIDCTWPSGVAIHAECFIPPEPNVLVVRWRVENWTPATRMGNKPPVWFSLYRWADPPIEAFAARFFADCRHDGFFAAVDPHAAPLTPPAVKQENGWYFIEQAMPADPTFPDGFACTMAPVAAETTVEPVNMRATGEALLHILPRDDAAGGTLVVAVATTRDAPDPLEPIRRVRAELGDRPEEAVLRWAEANRASAAAFWSRSQVRIADPLLENLWYETLHARRCAYRRGKVPPGLMLPSTVQDYSHWHGDYHTNYNFQEPFWGDYTANQLELGDSYFDGVAFMLPIGRKIARDYYGCRGAFIQLSMYPIVAADDPLGVVPMGRMAYMTGWTANPYWWRYRYTLDRDWLQREGYPVLRDCALFYTDFLKKGDDGLYHAFPSNQGEDGFSGNPADYTDRAQVITHARYCLQAALLAAEALDADAELREAWRDRLEHMAGIDGQPPLVLAGLEKACYELNPPEFGFGRPLRPQPETHDGQPWPAIGDGARTWYFGQYPWGVMGRLRGGEFIAERDLPAFRQIVAQWRRPNGLVWGMAVANYGRAGAWTESLGVIAPLQEMMLQSWDGALRVFPAWPKAVDASFDTFRAEGAFLVSASWRGGAVERLQIVSEKGAPCHVSTPWAGGFTVTDGDGKDVPVAPDAFGRPGFPTQTGGRYVLQAK